MATAAVTNTLVNGTTIDAADLNTNFSDLVTFLNASVLQKDGSVALTGALDVNGQTIDMGSSKITALSDGTALTDAATFKQADVWLPAFSQAGELAVGTGTFRFYPPFDCQVIAAYAMVGTAPTGADLQVDVNRNGTTIFTTQSLRPIVAASGFVDASGTPDGTATLTALTDYLSFDIDQVGSTIAGSDLAVFVHLRRT